MRVCFIAHTNSPWAPYYAAYFHAKGHDVHVISFHSDPLPDVQVHYLGPEAGGLAPKWMYLTRVPRVRRLLRELRPDVVMATYFQSNGLVGALSKCAPLVISTRGVDHDMYLPAPFRGVLIRWVARRADLIHASSPEGVDSLVAAGVPRDKFTVIPLGTDSTIFSPPTGPRPDGPPRLISTRKHDPVYDNETIIRAAAQLRDIRFDFRLRFVGSGTTIDQARQLASSLALASLVDFTGNAPHSAIPDHLRWADVYLSASRGDGAASSLFEAMSTGRFPIVSDIRANRDWIRHKENGWLFPVGDASSCAEGIRWAWDHPAERQRTAEENRRTVIEKLDRNAGLARLEELLTKAAAPR